MGAASIDNLIKTAQEEPQKIRNVIEDIIRRELSADPALQMFIQTLERFEEQWRAVTDLRSTVDESIISARKHYRELLKKTEASALRGKPRLYWYAKHLFARLRKNSLEYQIQEAEHKIQSLRAAQQALLGLLEKTRTGLNQGIDELLANRDIAEQKSRKHAFEIESIRNEFNSCERVNQELRNAFQRMEIKQSVMEAVVREMGFFEGAQEQLAQLRHIDSPRMLTSKLPYVGFSNRPKLKTLIEKSEYAAEHAERDLEKVKEGLKLANEAAVDGRATSVSIDWLAYCKVIVSRYEELAAQHVTPH
jgi:predicted XRE-type DNA-binding protein